MLYDSYYGVWKLIPMIISEGEIYCLHSCTISATPEYELYTILSLGFMGLDHRINRQITRLLSKLDHVLFTSLTPASHIFR